MRLFKLLRSNRGSALLVVVFLTLICLVATIGFFKKSAISLFITGTSKDFLDSHYSMESAQATAAAKLRRAADEMLLASKLRFVSGPTYETFNNIANTYATNSVTAVNFLRAMVTSQAYDGNGNLNSAHEFADFDRAFPTAWTDPDSSDSNYFEIKYEISANQPTIVLSPQQIIFEYEVNLRSRGFGRERYTRSESEENLVLAITIEGAPFSQWALFMDSMRNQNNGIVTFAGGNTSAEMQEIYAGPLHVNAKPYFYGHPAFLEIFTSGVAEGLWEYFESANYSGCPSNCPTFADGKQGGLDAISMPTQIFNTTRLAAGDQGSTAATNNTAVTEGELLTFLTNYAGGSMGAATSVPDGIYIPINDATAKIPTGGIYVQGDATISMNVVQGGSDFSASQWSNIQAGHQSCKFQKFSIRSLTSGVTPRDVYIGDDPCAVTYVFDSSSAAAPVVLNGRINGNIHVDGKIDELGGESRTRPAIAQDFGFNISATKDIRIINDIQYEDAEYVEVNSDNTLGSTVVADPNGAVGGSGISNTASNVAPTIPEESATVLGIMSTQRNVYIHLSAPADMNLHGAIYAGNSDHYDATTGYGCGENASGKSGCGFGYEGWNSETGKGNMKFLGSLSEYKSQTLGVLSSPAKGYASRYFYDSRLRQSITPPAFPVSDQPQVQATVRAIKTWRLVSAQ